MLAFGLLLLVLATCRAQECGLPAETCYQKWTNYPKVSLDRETMKKVYTYDGEVQVPCSVASGGLTVGFDPLQLVHLPFTSPGDYDLCTAFESAHFCTVDIENLVLPLACLFPAGTNSSSEPSCFNCIEMLSSPPTERTDWSKPCTLFPLTSFTMGVCIDKACSATDYLEHFYDDPEMIAMQTVDRLVAAINQTHAIPESVLEKYEGSADAAIAAFSSTLQALFKNSTSVRCVDETDYSLSRGAVLWIVLASLFSLLVLIGSVYELVVLRHWSRGSLSWERPDTIAAASPPPESTFDWFMRMFSAFHNSHRLTVPISGNFNCLNGMRFASMGWVILGHTTLTSISPSPVNPTAEVRYLQSPQFSLIKGAEFAVDTFFFMSGFLATIGVLKQLRKNRSLKPLQYLSMVMARFLRLTPVYMFVLLFFWKIMPLLGSGPYWAVYAGPESQAVKTCDKWWWTNLLYINNLHPFKAGVGDECMGWSWYLANDMQFFLLVPLLARLFVAGEQTSSTGLRFVLMYLPCLALVIIQLCTLGWTVEHYHSNGNDDAWQDYVYGKPWTRITPYAIGIALAFWHTDRVERHKQEHAAFDSEELENPPPRRGWKQLAASPLAVLCGLAVAFGAMNALIYGLWRQWKCEPVDGNTANCDSWMISITMYGFFASPNWNKAKIQAYFTPSYLVWSVCCMFRAPTPLVVVLNPDLRHHWVELLLCNDRAFFSALRSLGLAFISYAFFCGYGSTVARVLSHQTWFHAAAPAPTYFSETRILMEFLAFMFLAYAVAFLLYILIEKPLMNLLTAALRPKRRHNSQKNGDTCDLAAESNAKKNGLSTRLLDPEDKTNGNSSFAQRRVVSSADIDSESLNLSPYIAEMISPPPEEPNGSGDFKLLNTQEM